ncbi:MAG: hypothetical protein OEY03_13915, partial [Rhizobacter sp.]|nr:hypothetical protein [Rhizobacter sp.]
MNTKSALILVTLTLAVVAGSANARRLTPDVAVQWSGPSELQLGRAEHYRLGVSNVGFAAAYNVLATLSLPSGVTVENKPAECVQQGQQVKCNHSVIAVGETKTATIDLRAPTSGTTQAQLTFTASASGDNRQANNSATVRTM